jgi:hypothetical protein
MQVLTCIPGARRQAKASREIKLEPLSACMALAAMKGCAAREAAACGGVLSVASIPAHHARILAQKSGQVPRIYRRMLCEQGEGEQHAMLLLCLLARARLCVQ